MTDVNTQDNRITATPNLFKLQTHSGERLGSYNGGFFFTEKAAKRFMKEEGHNLPDDVHYYLFHAYRNPQIKNLLKALGDVTGLGYTEH